MPTPQRHKPYATSKLTQRLKIKGEERKTYAKKSGLPDKSQICPHLSGTPNSRALGIKYKRCRRAKGHQGPHSF